MDFFISASKFLVPDGKVLMTLCNGQGGTPADKPQREWFNSWQVVAMASYADLILTHTEEFVAEDFPEYSCTGYRGQGKGFNTEGAITHIFEKCPVRQEPAASPVLLHRGDRIFICPDELSVFARRNLLQDTDSPICEVYHRISERCTSMFNGLLIEESKEHDLIKEIKKECIQPFMYTLKEHNTKDASKTDEDARAIALDKDALQRDHTTEVKNKDPLVNISCNGGSSKKFENSKSCLDLNHQGTQFILSPSLLHFRPYQSDHKGETAKALVGPVFRRCPIGPEQFPITHELVLFLPENSCKHDSKEIVSSIISVVNPKIEIKFELLSIDSKEPTQFQECGEHEIAPETLQRLSDLQLENQKDQPSVSGSADLRKCLHPSKYHLMQQNIWVAAIRERCIELNFSSTYREVYNLVTVSLDTTFYEVGLAGIITSTTTLRSNIVIILNLDLLTMLCYNIDDVRLLWFQNTLLKRTTMHEISFISYSKFPPCYVRDLSFWVASAVVFPETQFFSIARDCCVDYIKSVNLIDVYKNEDTQCYSLCYRFVYQSCTSALCRSKVNRIHEYVVSKLVLCLGLELR
ncbi:ferredoxin-fold anticodon-binding domain-containing protein 1-like isoform X2 [Anneissia japonica]|nr:ferredoxin-fold anticodon-binding domain-containing protein 1-like isoform X2 [Anneissia japonica]